MNHKLLNVCHYGRLSPMKNQLVLEDMQEVSRQYRPTVEDTLKLALKLVCFESLELLKE